MVQQISITPNRIVTTRNSSAITFDTDNKYFKTTNSGNLKTERLMNSPLVTASNAGINVSSSGILLAMLNYRDMVDTSTIIKIPEITANGLTLRITFGLRAPWFPPGTPIIGTISRSGYFHSTSIIVTAYDSNGLVKNFVVADNLRRNINYLSTSITYSGTRFTGDYAGNWTYGATNQQVLSLEVNNVVPGSFIQVPALQGQFSQVTFSEFFTMIPICFYIRQTSKVETGLGLSS
jgi:hypothetical protein